MTQTTRSKAARNKISRRKPAARSGSPPKQSLRNGRSTSASQRTAKKWSARVTQTSDALDLKKDVFKLGSPKAIARSLKKSAEQSHRRKSDPYRSAMSMLVFYINRAGTNLPATRRKKLEAAKDELRKVFGRAA